MLKLRLQYFGYLIWRADSLENSLVLGKIEGKERGDKGWDGWMAPLIRVDTSLSKLQERVKDKKA